jgi:aconitate hydratase
VADNLSPRKRVSVTARSDSGTATEFQAVVRIDSRMEIEYYRHGGILQYVLRRLMREI